MKLNLHLFVLGALIISGTSCGNSVSEIPEDCEPEFPDEQVTYENYVKNIVSANCTISCHRGGGTEGPGNFTTYEGLLATATERAFVFRVITDNADMPQDNAPLPKSTRDSLNVWVSNCFPER